jgi:hypothetical protein
MEPPVMRTIGYRTNVLFILAAAFGLLAALGRPWYATAPATLGEEARIGEMQGPVEASFSRLGREISATDGAQGWDAFSSTDSILVVLLAIAVVSAIGSLASALEQPCRELLRLVTLAMLGIVIVKLVNTPDAVGLVERRQGAWIALGVTGIMASSAAALYGAKLTRRHSGPSLSDYNPNFVPPPRSDVFDTPYLPPLER